MIKKILFILITTCLHISVIQAQVSIASSGGDVITSTGNVSYTVGQVFVSSTLQSGWMISPGVQQSHYEISTLAIDKNTDEIQLSIFPNPTSDQLTLKTDLSKIENQSYEVYDLHGKLMLSEEIYSEQISIDSQSWSKGIYLVNVLNDGQLLRSFKVIKK